MVASAWDDRRVVKVPAFPTDARGGRRGVARASIDIGSTIRTRLALRYEYLILKD